MIRYKPLLILTALLLVHAADGSAAEKGSRIKKCQDANGVWHYGDTADEACAQSKVTVIDDKGIKRNEIAAPLTAQELQERERNKARIEADQKAAEEQAKRDQLLLATYGHDDDINLARDRKLSMIEAQIVTSEATIRTLRATLARMQAHADQEKKQGGKDSEQARKEIEKTEAQIKQQESYIAARRAEQEQVKQKYAAELKRYREIKTSGAVQASPPPAR